MELQKYARHTAFQNFGEGIQRWFRWFIFELNSPTNSHSAQTRQKPNPICYWSAGKVSCGTVRAAFCFPVYRHSFPYDFFFNAQTGRTVSGLWVDILWIWKSVPKVRGYTYNFSPGSKCTAGCLFKDGESSDSFAKTLQTKITLNLPWRMFEKAPDSYFKWLSFFRHHEFRV